MQTLTDMSKHHSEIKMQFSFSILCKSSLHTHAYTRVILPHSFIQYLASKTCADDTLDFATCTNILDYDTH